MSALVFVSEMKITMVMIKKMVAPIIGTTIILVTIVNDAKKW